MVWNGFLPSVCRAPAIGYHHEYVVACRDDVPCEVIVESSGDVYVETGTTEWISLDGIWFEVGE